MSKRQKTASNRVYKIKHKTDQDDQGGSKCGIGNTAYPASLNLRKCCYKFTLNNYTDQDDQDIYNFLTLKCRSWIYQPEIGEECGTPHLEGWMQLKNPLSIKQLKNTPFKKAHLEVSKEKRKEAAVKYCSKTKTKNGETKHSDNITLPKKTVEEEELERLSKETWEDWQINIMKIVESEPDYRTINWVVDPMGNKGKSKLTKWLYLKHNAVIASGKKADVFDQIHMWMKKYNWVKSPKVVLLDIPRHNIDYTNYGLLEEIKNALIFSGKFEGGVCCLKALHIIVFANQWPEQDKFTEDRWNIIEI